MTERHVAFEWLHQRVDTGQIFVTEVLLNRVDINRKTLIQGTIRDITARKQAENYDQFRIQILEMLAGNESLIHTLQSIAAGVELLHTKMLCSILLLDKEKNT